MIGYVTLGTNDLERAAAFYDALLAEIGGKRTWETARGFGWSTDEHLPSLGILKPFDGHAASVGNGVMVAIAVDSRDKVERLHRKALALGGTDEGAVGFRGPGFYAGYFRDLDGNKLGVYCECED